TRSMIYAPVYSAYASSRADAMPLATVSVLGNVCDRNRAGEGKSVPTPVRARRTSSPHPVQPVTAAVPYPHHRTEPGRATVERHWGEVQPIQCEAFVSGASHFQGGVVAHPAGHGDARALAARRVVDAILHADMRQEVEGEGHIAVPGMGHANVFQLR